MARNKKFEKAARVSLEKMMSVITDRFFSPFRVFARKIEFRLCGRVALRPRAPMRGQVLLSYVTHPFLISKKELNKSPHTNPWECLIIADILLERGYAVDIIDWTDASFEPKKHYVMVIDVHGNLERMAPYLPKECAKIFYITGAHWKYQNEAELKGLAALKERRGVTLPPRRQVTPSKNIEYADYATSLGNDFAKSTYAFAGKEITQIPLLTIATFSSPAHKQFEKIRKNFVWVGGGGGVHKGLDLVLECFAVMPAYHLTVCGPVEGDKNFYDFYRKELYDLPNIKLMGRLNVRGEQFREIVNNAVGLVYPSVSEGQAGSVIVGLHAGLIPIATRESGVDVSPFGITLTELSVKKIRAAIQMIAALPKEDLRKRAILAWEYARGHHSKEIFREKYAAFIDRILKERNL